MTEYYLPKPEVLFRIPDKGHAVIEASAGTGKTYTIEHIFVDLLLTKEVSVEEILVLTFTEKAASELRSRIRGILETAVSCGTTARPAERHWTIAEREMTKLEYSLFALNRAPIHTIHGFFQRTLKEYAFGAGRLFDQKLTDGRSFFSSVFKKALREEFARDPVSAGYLSFWVEEMELSVEDLDRLLYECYKNRCELRPLFDPDALGSEILLLSRQLTSPDALEKIERACRSNKANARTISKMMSRMEILKGACEVFLKDRALLPFLLRAESAEKDYLCEKISHARPCDPGTESLICSVLKLPGILISPKALIAGKFMQKLGERVRVEKSREGLYDFDDMIMSLWEAVEGPQGRDLVKALRAGYRYALIDESQDTDGYQWKIFKRVFLESGGANIIYLIGDPKQAIYGFRGADVFAYLEARSDICGEAPAVPLSENFRSTAEMTGAFNTLFDQGVERPFFSGEIRYGAPVACGRKDLLAVDARMERITPVKIVKVSADGTTVNIKEFREKIGNYIAREIGRILDGTGGIRTGTRNSLRPVAARDIFILTRTDAQGIQVSWHLRKAGIPFSFYKQEGLFQTAEAEEIRDLLAALEDPHDRSKRFRAWMTPFFGISLERLAECRDLPESEEIVKMLMDWHALAANRRYEELFSTVLDRSGLIRKEIFLSRHERRLTNFLHIFEILLEEVNASVCDISELVSSLNCFINETRSPAGENGNIQRLESEKEAVQIMTMHKSKGLESEVVFILGGMTMTRQGETNRLHEEGKRVLYIGKMPAEREREFLEEAREEEQRLLYVAATRAKTRLYLPYISPDEMGPGLKGPYREMIYRLSDVVRSGSRFFEMEDAEEYADVRADGRREPDAGALSDWKPPLSCLDDSDESGLFEELKSRHAGFEILSYSAIKKKRERMAINLEQREDPEEIAYRPDEGEKEFVGGAEFGSAVHDILERVPFESFLSGRITREEWGSGEAISRICGEALLANGVEAEHLGYAQQLAFNALASPVILEGSLNVPGLWNVTSPLREVEFLYPFPEEGHPAISSVPGGSFSIDRGFLKGFIDFIFEWNAKIFFADWKTDSLRDYSPQALKRHFEDNYRLQTKLYLIAMAKMLSLHNRALFDEKFGGVLYCFLRGMRTDGDGSAGIFFVRPSWEDLLSYEEELLRYKGCAGAADG